MTPTTLPLCRDCGTELAPDLAASNRGLHLGCTPPEGPDSTVAEMRDVFITHDANSPRSLQTAIGPSEIGVSCDRALAHRVAGTPRRDDVRVPWAPILGTALHAYVADMLRAENTRMGRQRWVVEERVWMTEEISGSCDAYDDDNNMIIDWKLVGDNSILKYKRRMRPEYETQAHLYGLGHANAGRPVQWVRLVFLHRSHDYDKSWEWTARYDPGKAHAALSRLAAITHLLGALNVADHPHLWGAVPSQPTPDCSWCPYFRPGPPDATGCPGDEAANARRLARTTKGIIDTKEKTNA